MLTKQIQEAREALEKATINGELHSEEVFALSRELDELVLQHHNQGLYEVRARSPEEAKAKSLINSFLRQKGLVLADLKDREFACHRNELILKMRVDAGFTVYETAKYLGLNRGLVQLSIKELKQRVGNNLRYKYFTKAS